jgi:hypothetical protein
VLALCDGRRYITADPSRKTIQARNSETAWLSKRSPGGEPRISDAANA